MNNIYCDESCYLKNDGRNTMVFGGIVCHKNRIKFLNKKINELKKDYGLTADKELKWTKLTKKYFDLYKAVIDLLMKDDRVAFRVVLVKEKKYLKYEEFNQTHNQWYNKMYYFLLSKSILSKKVKKVFIDKKDSKGGVRIKEISNFLRKRKALENKKFEIFQLDSKDSSFIQCIDVFIGMISYSNNYNLTEKNNAKANLIKYFINKYGVDFNQKLNIKNKKIKIYDINLSNKKEEKTNEEL